MRSAGFLAALLGVIVLVGWHAHILVVMRLHPSFIAMRYNTALGFLLAGAGLVALSADWPKLTRALGSLLLALAVLTGLQYLGGWNVGIDEAFMRDYLPEGTTSPGRMAPNTAMAFTLHALALWISSVRPFRSRPLIVGLLATALLTMGLVSVGGYLSGMTALATWGRFAYMALHTAVGMILLGLGMAAFAWRDQRPPERDSPAWLPIPTGIGVLLISLMVQQALRTQEEVVLEGHLHQEVVSFARVLELDFETRRQAIQRMVRRWEVSSRPPARLEWESDAEIYVTHQPGYRALEWVDSSLRVRWVVPRKGNETYLDFDLRTGSRSLAHYELAKRTGTFAVGPDIDLDPGDRGFVLVHPINRQGRFEGYIVVVFSLERWFKRLATAPHLAHFRVEGSGHTLLSEGASSPALEAKALSSRIGVGDARWLLRVQPTEALLNQVRSRLPAAVGILGWGLALLSAGLVWAAQTAREGARRLGIANQLLETSILERDRSAKQLLEMSAAQTLILKNSTVGIALVRDRRFIWVNQRVWEMLGLELTEIQGQSTRVIYPDEQAYLQLGRQAYPVMARGEVAEQELELARTDGTRFWCRFLGKALDPEHVDDGSIWMFEDISKQVQAERMKHEFVSAVSHELRTPLTAIKGTLVLLQGGITGPLSPQSQELVAIARNNCERLVMLVNDILDMEKLGSGHMEIATEPMDLVPTLQQALVNHRGFALQHQISLRLLPGPPSAWVQGDPHRVQQALDNLLSNASKFSHSGATVELELLPRSEAWRIEVRDQGRGIPPAFRQTIFQPFTQVDGSDAREKGGTGLGLSIARTLVERMGGRLDFESEEGAGSTFWIELPAVPSPGP